MIDKTYIHWLLNIFGYYLSLDISKYIPTKDWFIGFTLEKYKEIDFNIYINIFSNWDNFDPLVKIDNHKLSDYPHSPSLDIRLNLPFIEIRLVFWHILIRKIVKKLKEKH